MSHPARRPAIVVAALAIVAAAAGAASPPRTEWGTPDLRGTWNNATLTPMERPAEMGDRTQLTEEEAEALRGTGVERILSQVGNTLEGKTSGELTEIFLDPGTEVVRTLRTSLVVDPPDGKIPFTKEGRQRQTHSMLQLLALTGPLNSHEDLHIASRCLWTGNFYAPNPLYLNMHQIFQTPDYVAIVSEIGPQTRIVPLDGRPPLDEELRFWDGSSRGRWEGDTLVIETANFDGRNPFAGSTDGLR
ncbi:MAG: hypothetical protein R3190_02610, partial [Thermoanaerobaculia bacterium]|nr:hypothetical protein [Thermoanaerobaculia bacterium]